MSDFVTVDSIGEGSYSSVREVFLADKPSERYALKVMDKATSCAKRKRGTWRQSGRCWPLDCRMRRVVALRFTFQDYYSLYMGMELCPGGDLYWQLKRSKNEVMAEDKVVFYVSEVIRACNSVTSRRGAQRH